MAAEDRDKARPSLEAPSLGLGRLRRRKSAQRGSDDATEVIVPVPADDATAPPAALRADSGGRSEELRADSALPPPPLFVDESPNPTGATRVDAPASRPEASPFRPRSDFDEPTTTAPKRQSRRQLPTLVGRAAAAVTGLLVGLLLVLLVFLGLRGCDVVSGTPSCGGGTGLLLLLAIFAASVLAGSLLLRLFGIAGPTSTAFLAIATTTVLSMLFFGSQLDAWWMALVIPALCVLTFSLYHWVTGFVERTGP